MKVGLHTHCSNLETALTLRTRLDLATYFFVSLDFTKRIDIKAVGVVDTADLSKFKNL